ncbi:MAG: thiol reductant ABC exporter subunit CydD [Microthrixaceae bacterium]
MWPRSLLAEHPSVRRWVMAAVFGGLAAAVILIAWTILLAGVINDGFIEKAPIADLLPVLAIMAALLILRATCIWTSEISSQHASGLLRDKIRSATLNHLVSVGPAGLGHERNAEITTTLGQGVDALDPYLSRFLPAAALAGIVPAAVFLTIAILDPWTTLILLFTGPMLILLLVVIGSRTRLLAVRRFEELGWLSSFYLDMIQGLGTLKAFGRSQDGADMVEQVSRRYGEATMDVLRTAFQTSLMMEWAATAATALVAVQISFRLIRGDISFDLALAVLILTPEFFAPLRRLAIEYHAGQEGNAAVERIEELNALPIRRVPPQQSTNLMSYPRDNLQFRGLEFYNVSYRYAGATQPTLQQLNLSIQPGESVAVIGPSGAGKSTIVKLLMQFIQPDSGEIRINGLVAASMDLADLRGLVTWVPQQPAIFAGTVAENIALGNPQASDSEILEAARVACAEEFISDLPEGMSTLLGESGLRLSGGQRQRIAIARAALMDTPLVLLDEFTAHLDEETEAQVIAAMGALMQHRTSVVIAHRAATIASAQRVLSLDGGRLTEVPR